MDTAMGKVYKTQYTVDHGIANGNQRIQAADRYAGQQQIYVICGSMHITASSYYLLNNSISPALLPGKTLNEINLKYYFAVSADI